MMTKPTAKDLKAAKAVRPKLTKPDYPASSCNLQPKVEWYDEGPAFLVQPPAR